MFTIKKTLHLVLLSSILFCAMKVRAEVLTIYSDVGISGNDVGVFSDGGGATFDANFTGLSNVPEGLKVFKTQHTSWAGWDILYNSAQNFSTYSSGQLRFWIYSSTGDIKVEIKKEPTDTTAIFSKNLLVNGWNWNIMHDRWVEFRFDFNGLDLSSIKLPFIITANQATFYVDFVRLTQTTSDPIFNVTLKNISDNSTATQITWSNLNLPNRWVRAGQYAQVELDPDNSLSWGLQIYTDNKASDANPAYTGSSDPMGLVDMTTTTKTVPLAWTVKPATSTVGTNIIPPVAADPNNSADANSFQWLFFKDRHTSGYTDGEPYIAVKKNLGIHFNQGTTNDTFGAANTPNYIYFEGDFSNAVTPRTYKTTTIRLEFYHQ